MKGTYRYDKKARGAFMFLFIGKANLIGYSATMENLSGTKRLPTNY
jgi:hypothetical protein